MPNLSLEQYEHLDSGNRVAYLGARVSERTSLSEEFILQVLKFESDPFAQWFLIKGLGIVKSVVGIPLIINFCKAPEVTLEHSSLHLICAWSLGQIGQPAFASVIDLLGSADAETRRCAVDALGELRNPQAIEALRFALENDEDEVKLWAGLSLAKIGEKAIPYLHQVITSSKPKVRIIALDAVLKVGSDSSLPVIRQLLHSEGGEEKKLILLKGNAFHQALLTDIRQITTSEEPELQRLAHGALANI